MVRCPECGQFAVWVGRHPNATIWCKGCPTVAVTVDGDFRHELTTWDLLEGA